MKIVKQWHEIIQRALQLQILSFQNVMQTRLQNSVKHL